MNHYLQQSFDLPIQHIFVKYTKNYTVEALSFSSLCDRF